jgi:pyruvate dehydrogenase E2 component (dihydrolipoamide acetyltransferase)
MARIAIEMPKLGYDMETGVVSSWLKQVGDTVARGEAIAEVETDKTTVEIPVGQPIAYLEDGA